MIKRLIIFGFIALIGISSFLMAVIYLTRGLNAEWITIILAPISGICLAIIMNFANIDLKIIISLLAKDGHFSIKISQA